MKEIEDFLWTLTVPNIQDHCKKLGIKTPANKKDKIEKVIEFYEQEDWFEEYFKSLSGFDKEYTYLIVQQNFAPIASEVRALKEKYNIKSDYFHSYQDNLKFSINGFIPEIYREKLLKLVPPIPTKFIECQEKIDLDSYYAKILSRNDPIKKFDDFILYVNTNKIKVTEKNKAVTKSSILKFCDKYAIEDITRHEHGKGDDPKNQNDTIFVNGIVDILLVAKIIKVKDGLLLLDKNYQDYIKMDKVNKAKYLLNCYIHSDINETKRLTNALYRTPEKMDLTMPRKSIIEYLKKFPIDKWVASFDLKRMLRIKDHLFLRRYTGNIEQKEDYYNWYVNAYFDDFEYGFIDSVLMDYLAILGLVDVGINFYYSREGRYFLSVDIVKVTEFGAMVLGLIEQKPISKIIKPLMMKENFDIIIEDGSKRMEYELYFDRFLDKVQESKEETIYKLSFEGLAKAYDLGINPKEILKFIKEECKEVPKNVTTKVEEWFKSLDKVKIRTVTILEAPSDIMEILLSSEKIDALKEKEKNEYMIIKKGKSEEVKKEVEANIYFCKVND